MKTLYVILVLVVLTAVLIEAKKKEEKSASALDLEVRGAPKKTVAKGKPKPKGAKGKGAKKPAAKKEAAKKKEEKEEEKHKKPEHEKPKGGHPAPPKHNHKSATEMRAAKDAAEAARVYQNINEEAKAARRAQEEHDLKKAEHHLKKDAKHIAKDIRKAAPYVVAAGVISGKRK